MEKIRRPLGEAMGEFMSEVYQAKLLHPKGGGVVYADLSVIMHYNQGTMLKGFIDAGYFIFDGVEVREKNPQTLVPVVTVSK